MRIFSSKMMRFFWKMMNFAGFQPNSVQKRGVRERFEI